MSQCAHGLAAVAAALTVFSLCEPGRTDDVPVPAFTL